MKYYELSKCLSDVESVLKSDIEFPISASLAIIRNRKNLQDAMAPYNELHDSIVRKYANGRDRLSQGDENYDKCVKEMTELDLQECDVRLSKFSESVIKDLKVPINILSKIAFMIEEE